MIWGFPKVGVTPKTLDGFCERGNPICLEVDEIPRGTPYDLGNHHMCWSWCSSGLDLAEHEYDRKKSWLAHWVGLAANRCTKNIQNKRCHESWTLTYGGFLSWGLFKTIDVCLFFLWYVVSILRLSNDLDYLGLPPWLRKAPYWVGPNMRS